MAKIRAFKAVRPRADMAHLIASLPYDVMNREEAVDMVKKNPYSFLHVDKAEIDLDRTVDPYDVRVYQKANENLYRMIKEGLFIQDKKPCLYIYRLTMNGKSQIGIVACTAIDDYINNVIKKHENTREDKEKDRINHVDFCNANTGPIFLTYRHEDEINKIVDEWIKNEKVYSFTSIDGISHEVWAIDDESIIEKLQSLFGNIKYLYIADGHHRAASAIKVGLKRREQHGDFTGNEEFNYFLSVIFPDNKLRIMDYNRVVQDLNNLSISQFLERISVNFNIAVFSQNKPYKPEKKHTFGMYLNNKWYSLESKPGTFDDSDPVSGLDVSILQNNVLGPILGIDDPRTDSRIDFIGGIRGLKELEKRVNEGMKVAFSMYPTSIEDLMDIADVSKIMPPKSTWFEPKLRSGLFIHLLE